MESTDPSMKASGNHVKDAPTATAQRDLAAAGIDAALVRAQLERILASTPFRNSKRYPALLRYVVEQELRGAAADLKERTIGMDVFGRDSSYDPGADPVVRVSAGEVRKRLAQYYQQTASDNELRIELPLGSYHPEFVVPAHVPATATWQPELPVPVPLEEVSRQTGLSAKRRKATILYSVLLAVFVLLSSAIFYRFATRNSALDLFWSPVIKQTHSVLICMGRAGLRPGSNPVDAPHPIDPNQSYVAWWDAETMAQIAGSLQSRGASVHLLRESEATFSDFQQSPAVLIGAFNDQWTLEFMAHMRYTFQKTGNVQWIMDKDRPGFQDWKVDLGQKDGQGNLVLHEDFAVLSRVANPRTGFITVTVAGLWGYGTLSAGRFLTDPTYFEEYSRRTGFEPGNKNMQIVLATEVIQGRSGPPRVVAATSW